LKFVTGVPDVWSRGTEPADAVRVNPVQRFAVCIGDVRPGRNGGPGVALNVEGHVKRATEGDRIALFAGSIAPGHTIEAPPAGNRGRRCNLRR
jgi:hypothetical protein